MPESSTYPSFAMPEAKSVLTDQQKADFARDGLLIIENFFSNEEAAAFDKMARELEEMPDEKGVFHRTCKIHTYEYMFMNANSIGIPWGIL